MNTLSARSMNTIRSSGSLATPSLRSQTEPIRPNIPVIPDIQMEEVEKLREIVPTVTIDVLNRHKKTLDLFETDASSFQSGSTEEVETILAQSMIKGSANEYQRFVSDRPLVATSSQLHDG